MRSHLMINGDWADCSAEDCSLLHVELSTTEATNLPSKFLEALVEAFDPPSPGTQWTGAKSWAEESGRPHRDYGMPSQIYPDGSRYWHRHGSLHREGGQPAVISYAKEHTEVFNGGTTNYRSVTLEGTKEWWVNGVRHREDGPAVINEDTGYEAWYFDGAFHRSGDLPAVRKPDGSVEYWEEGDEVIACRNRIRLRRVAQQLESVYAERR